MSTQSLSALTIDLDTGAASFDTSISFEQDLPEYKSPAGVLPHENPERSHANPLMWVDALELLFEKMKRQGFPFARVHALSAGAQQHGTVYLNRPLDGLDEGPHQGRLSQRVRGYLSRATSPLWMDTSSADACLAFAEAAGGAENVRQRSGSNPEARFAAAQIRAFSKSSVDAYRGTRRIHLVSSFLSSLLIGSDSPLDISDALGMNLVSLKTRDWDDTLVRASAPELHDRLPRLTSSNTQVGTISRTLRDRYGFSSGAGVYVCTGDNPSSLVGTGATSPGHVVVSLGTSDTIMAAVEPPQPGSMKYGHLFGNPFAETMALICFSNGSLAREQVAKLLNGDWKLFESALSDSQPGNGGQRMLPYFFPEITPRVPSGGPWLFGDESFVNWKRPQAAARAVIEAQAVLMRHYSRGVIDQPEQLLFTGGASQNVGILQIFSDVFQAPVKTLSSPASVALGAALRAAHATTNTPPKELYARFLGADSGAQCQPTPAVRSIYETLEQQLIADTRQTLPSPFGTAP